MLITGLLLIFVHTRTVSPNYFCACNYEVEKEVHSTMSEQGATIGYIYEFDCKQEITPENEASGWIAVAFQHQMGYIQDGPQIQNQTCPGDPPTEDLVSTTTFATPKTTSVPSTLTTAHSTPEASTTHRPAVTTPTSSFKPTTVPTTHRPTTETTQYHQTTVTKPTPSTETATPTHSTTTTVASIQLPTTAPPPMTPQQVTTQTTTGMTNVVTGHLELCPSQVVHAAYIGHGLVVQYDTSCYEVVPSLVSWTHAESNCKRSGAHLVTINSAMEQNFLYNPLDTNYNHSVWIGLDDRQNEDIFTWASGENVSYTNWVPNRKSINHDSEDCVYMVLNQGLQGKWDDVPCGRNDFLEQKGERHRYICEYHVDPAMTTFATVSPGPHTNDGHLELCPSQVVHAAQNGHGLVALYGTSCYEVVPSLLSWSHAETNCKLNGGHLVTINSAMEQNFLYNLLDTNYNRSVWIGLHDSQHEELFTWASGENLSYTNWVPNRKSINHDNEDCVYMGLGQGLQGKWDDVPCGGSGFLEHTGERHSYICEYQIDVAGSIIG